MADEGLVSGIDKLQVEGTQQTEKVNASEQEKSIVPEKLQCDGSESGGDSGSEKEKDAAVAKGGGQGEKKKKKVPKKKKKGTKKIEGEGSMADKLQCDNSDSKSGSGDDSSGSKSGSGDDSGNSKSGSGDDSKSESGCATKVLEEVKKLEKKKGLIEKIREKLSRKPKNETAAVNEEISETKDEDKQNIDKLQCDSSDSKSNSNADCGSESCSGKEKDTVLKGGATGEKKKVLRKKIKKKATKKIDGEASTADKLHCDSSDSKSGSGDDNSGSKSGSKSGSGDDSKSESGAKSDSGDDSKSEYGSSSKKEKSKVKIANKEEEKKGEEGNQSSMAETEGPPDTKVDESNAADNLKVLKEMEKDQDEGKKVKVQGVDEQGANEKKSILGKIMEKLPGYYKSGGE